MSVDLCCINGNAKQTSYYQDRDALHSEMRGVSVPKRVGSTVFPDTGFRCGCYDVFPKTVSAESGLLKTLKDVWSFVWKHFKYLNGLFGYWHCTFIPRFCTASLTISDAKKPLRYVYILPLKICQFVTANTCRSKDDDHRFNAVISNLHKAMNLFDGQKDHLMPFARNEPHYLNRVFGKIAPFNCQVKDAFQVDNGMVYCGCLGAALKPPRLIFFQQGEVDVLQFDIRGMPRLFKESTEYSRVFPVSLNRERSKMDFDMPVVFFKETGKGPAITACVFSSADPELDVFFDIVCNSFIAGFQGLTDSLSTYRVSELNPVVSISPVSRGHVYHVFATINPSQKRESGEYRNLLIWISTTPSNCVNTIPRRSCQVENRKIAEDSGIQATESTTFLPRFGKGEI